MRQMSSDSAFAKMLLTACWAVAWLALFTVVNDTRAEVAPTAAPSSVTEAADESVDERARIYAAANAIRTRLVSGDRSGAGDALVALASRLSALPDDADRAHVAIHLARSELLLAEPLDGHAASASRVRAAQLLITAATDAAQANAPRLEAYAWGTLGEIYLDGARIDDARRATERAVLLARRADSPDATYRFQAQLGRIEREAGNTDAAIAAYRSAFAVVSAIRIDLASESLDAGFAFKAEVEPVYLALVDLLLARASGLDTEAAQPLIREARDTLEALKTAELRDHLGDDCLASQKRVAPDDVPGAAVLYPVVLPDRVELIVGRDGVLTLHRSPLPRADLEANVRDMRRHVASAITRRYRRPAADLHAALIAPIEARLEGADVLVVIPGGVLRTIPFSALYDAERRAHLIERIAVVVSPGLTLTEPRRFPGRDTSVLAAGLSQARQGYEALPSVANEIDGIAATFPTTELLDRDLTSANLDEAVATQALGVVHIASHGEFNADASESFIVTWDEKLPMDQFAATISRTARRNDAPLELLVLSACETAAGDERAALGLAGIAIQSGARSAVATLWSVNDMATGRLIERFYRELAAGRSRAEALRAAQLQLLEDETFSHPAFWSPFLLVSNWL